jgi:UrcA family protein
MKISIFAGVALALAASTGAFAAENAVQVRAATAGLNLSQDQDARVMLRRLDNAATEACGASRFSFPDARRAVQRSECHRSAMTAAVQSLSAPRVTSLYRADVQTFASR